jgi:hypothetical protein
MDQSLANQLARYRKSITAFAGAASLAVSQGLIEGVTAKWIGLGISVLTALGVYAVPNQPAVAPAAVTVPAAPQTQPATA